MVPQVGEKINYERGFLLELRMSPLSMVRPHGCHDTEVILHEPIIKVASQVTHETKTYSEEYFSQGFKNRHIITGITLQGDVTLHTSEKPWKPAHKDDSKTEKNKTLEAAVLFIMNRLTPSNFEKLAEEMRALEIKTYNDLELVVNVVFDKVSLETKFVQAYAALCKVMLGFQVEPPPSMPSSRATFRAILVSKCQQTFEADKSLLFEDPEQTKSRIIQEMSEDTPARAEHIEMTLYQMKLKRLKFFGNISFIGELFKLGILPEVIIHSCITRLLGTPDEESLLSLCKLITTVGKHIDNKKAKQLVDNYFARISQLANASKSRLKFSLKDIIELRKNKWKSRNEQAGPKTIAQLHKDFKEEQAQVQSLQSVSCNQQNNSSVRQAAQQRQGPAIGQTAKSVGYQDNRANKKQIAKNQEPVDLLINTESDKENDPTWSQVNSKTNKKGKKRCSSNINNGSIKPDKNPPVAKVAQSFSEADRHTERDPQSNANINLFAEGFLCDANEDENLHEKLSNADIGGLKKIDASRLKFSRTTIDDDVKLVPGAGRMGMSFIVSRYQTLQRDPESVNLFETTGSLDCKNNRFSLLHDVSNDEEIIEAVNPNDHNFYQTKQCTKKKRRRNKASSQNIPNKLMSDELPLEPSQITGNVASDIKDKSTSTKDASSSEKTKGMQLTLDELELRCKDIIDEFLNCRDEMELQQCVKELVGFSDIATFVSLVFNHVLEKTNDVRQLIGQMFDGLMKKNIISVDEFIRGFSEIMALAEDMVIDIPMLWAYLAQLLTPMLGQSLPWAMLDKLLTPFAEAKSCSMICAHIFSILNVKGMEHEDIQVAWHQTGLVWTQFMEADKLALFLADHRIDNIFLTSEDNVHSKSTIVNAISSPSSNVTMEEDGIEIYPNNILDYANAEELCKAYSDLSNNDLVDKDGNVKIVQTESNKINEAESVNNCIDFVLPVYEAPEAVSGINQAVLFENHEIVQTHVGETGQAFSFKNATVSELAISQNTNSGEPDINNHTMIKLCEAGGFKSCNTDEVVSCDLIVTNSPINELLRELSESENLINSPPYDDRDLDEEGEALWRKEMEEDELHFNSCFVRCQGEFSDKKFIICCIPSVGDNEVEEESHSDNFDSLHEASFKNKNLHKYLSGHINVKYSQTYGSPENDGMQFLSPCSEPSVISYIPWSTDSQEDLFSSYLSVDAPAFMPSCVINNVIPRRKSSDIMSNDEHSINTLNCENNLTAEWTHSESWVLGQDEKNYATQNFCSDNQKIPPIDDEVMDECSTYEQNTEISDTFSTILSHNSASHLDDTGELGGSLRSIKITDLDQYISPLSSQDPEATFSLLTAHRQQATQPTPLSCASPVAVQSYDTNPSHTSRILDQAPHCNQHKNIMNIRSENPPLLTLQNRTNSPNIMQRCKLAMCDIAELLRQYCSNVDLIIFIESHIFNTGLEKFALSMFMTVIGYTALTAMNPSIITERRDVLAFLINYNPDLELEAIKALHFVMTFVPEPLGIIDLYNALYTEGLVSHEVLLHWSVSLTTREEKRNFVAQTVICAFDSMIASLRANSEC